MSTIVAISTAPGVGGIGIVRMSGNECFEILDKVFKAKNPQKIEEIKLELAKEYCEKYNFDFEKYLEQKKIVESMKTPRVSTEEMLEEIRES